MGILALKEDSSSYSLRQLLKKAIELDASDIHLQVNRVPMVRVQGAIVTFESRPLDLEDLRQISMEVLSFEQSRNFESGNAVDVAYEIPVLEKRFRFNFSYSQGEPVIAIRIIALNVPNFKELNLPPILEKISDYRRGLVLVVGTTGSGKSTTLAAMIRHICGTQQSHIVTIEDPIEYVFEKKAGLITQQEIGKDIPDYKVAMRNVLRQDPDVLVIGEMRDRETIDAALLAAETGHFVIATLHTLDAAETIHRILSAYDSNHQPQVRQQLASILRAVVGLRLLPKADKSGMIPAVEVLINTDRIKGMIAEPKRIHEISDAIEESHDSFGMQSFDQSIMGHLRSERIDIDTALRSASRPGLFELRCQGVHSMGGEKKWNQFDRKGGSPQARPMATPEAKKAPVKTTTAKTLSKKTQTGSVSAKTPAVVLPPIPISGAADRSFTEKSVSRSSIGAKIRAGTITPLTQMFMLKK